MQLLPTCGDVSCVALDDIEKLMQHLQKLKNVSSPATQSQMRCYLYTVSCAMFQPRLLILLSRAATEQMTNHCSMWWHHDSASMLCKVLTHDPKGVHIPRLGQTTVSEDLWRCVHDCAHMIARRHIFFASLQWSAQSCISPSSTWASFIAENVDRQ